MDKSLAVSPDARRHAGIPVFKFARSRDELVQAFQLTFREYYRSGLVVDNPSGLRVTPYHLLPTSEVFVGRLDETVFATLSLFCDSQTGLPMDSMYSREVDSLRNKGLRLAEVGSFTDRRQSPVRFLETFLQLCRLMVQCAASRDVEALVAVSHPRHAKLYKRALGFEQIGKDTSCPYANGNPGVPLFLRFDDFLGTELHQKYFGEPVAKEELRPYRWDESTHEYFSQILEYDGKIANAVGLTGYHDWSSFPAANISSNV